MKAALVIMAAGMGSRYGGEKQTDGIGPAGETLMEYSIFDAVRAGFTKVVFIIKPEMQKTVKELFGDRLANVKAKDGENVSVEYAFQDFSRVPDFYKVPQERTKPFGTVHAVLCASGCVSEPFAVINADDYYGVQSFDSIYRCLISMPEKNKAAMVGYYLKNTVSENGTVTRGVCKSEDGKLVDVTETYKIMKFKDGTIRDTQSDPSGVLLDPESIVSMNFWGFSPWMFGEMEKYFHEFLKKLTADDIKAECLLPSMVDKMIKEKRLEVEILTTKSSWFGMTYKEDKALVSEKIKMLHDDGTYPGTLR